MLLAPETIDCVCDELTLVSDLLPAGARVLELGCGKAEKTRAIAQGGKAGSILALEVDQAQHAKNLQIDDLPQVRFASGGAQEIPADDASFDMVLMFKSLHHVPMPLMDQALDEIARVLKPGGVAWISEPVYAGELNEVFKLFHDEKVVREAAFAAICKAIERGLLVCERQLFFNTRSYFENFERFDQRMIQVTHTRHQLAPELYARVKAKFESYLGPEGATFLNPQRVDVLRKPA